MYFSKAACIRELSAYIGPPGLVEITAGYCGRDTPDNFQALIRHVVPDPFYGYAWTSGGAIKWELWTGHFVRWCLKNKKALLHLPLDTASDEWMQPLILFYVQYAAEHGYGSYEAQILLHSYRVDKTYIPSDELWSGLEPLVKKMDSETRSHLPVLRFLFLAGVRPIIARQQPQGYSLLYNTVVRQVKLHMEETRRAFLF